MVVCLERGANIAYRPADATATPSSPNPEWLTFLVPAYPGCPRKRPLSGCSSSNNTSKQSENSNLHNTATS